MTKITLMGCVVAVAASATLSADTAVTTAAFTPNADGTVSVTYTLAGDEPAVVTMDARIGGASIEAGGRFVRRVTGDVNRIVVPGEHAIVWHAREDLGASPGDLSDFAVTVSAWKTNDPPLYMSFDLESKDVRYYTSSNALPQGGAVTGPYAGVYAENCLLLRRINAANVRWPMGSTGEGGDASREKIHYVTLTNDYYMGVFELTKYQWIFIDGTGIFNRPDPGWIGCDPQPIAAISYDEVRGQYCYWPDEPIAGSFLDKLRAMTGFSFDLPSESQWEFAARAGHYSGYWGDGSPLASTLNNGKDANLDRLAWWRNMGGAATCVGSRAPNDWGLYDVFGNVWEWTLDVNQANITANTYGQVVEPSNRTANNKMIVRGGCYYTANQGCRPAQRGTNDANDKNANGKCGFRICLMLPGQAPLATPYDAPRPLTPASSFTTAASALDLATPSPVTSGGTALDTRPFTEDESDAGPLITTEWVGTIIIFR